MHSLHTAVHYLGTLLFLNAQFARQFFDVNRAILSATIQMRLNILPFVAFETRPDFFIHNGFVGELPSASILVGWRARASRD